MANERQKLSSKSFAVKGSDRTDGFDKGKLSSQSFSAPKTNERLYIPRKGVVRQNLLILFKIYIYLFHKTHLYSNSVILQLTLCNSNDHFPSSIKIKFYLIVNLK